MVQLYCHSIGIIANANLHRDYIASPNFGLAVENGNRIPDYATFISLDFMPLTGRDIDRRAFFSREADVRVAEQERGGVSHRHVKNHVLPIMGVVRYTLVKV